MKKLKEDSSILIDSVYFMGRPYSEVADELNIPAEEMPGAAAVSRQQAAGSFTLTKKP